MKTILNRTKQLRKTSLFVLGMGALLLAGCAKPNLKAPCPDYGKHCKKIPVNSWNYK